jgi:4-oxalocrotonate tautomerase
MPFVHVRTARGLLAPEDRMHLQGRITDLLVEIEGRGNPAFAKFVTVLVEELDPVAWCIEGNALSEDAIEALAGSL